MVVVGAGIAGLSVADALLDRGVEVVVLDRVGPGAGASWGNAGWISPLQAGPLPMPGHFGAALRGVLSAEGALRIPVANLPRMSGWLLAFATHCRTIEHARGVVALSTLAAPVFDQLDALERDGVDADSRRDGMLVAGSQASVERFLAEMRPAEAAGLELPGRVVVGRDLRDLEPALTERVAAAVHVEQHWRVEPDRLVRGLAARVRDRGGTIVESATVVAIDAGRERVVVSTPGRCYRADAVVVAGGADSGRLVRLLGIGLPLAAGRGYSFDVEPEVVPRRPVLLLEPHVACSPFGLRLRIAGGMDLGFSAPDLDRRRVAAIARSASPYLRGLGERRGEWAGLRPVLPDGLPLIDRLPVPGRAYAATGYAMLGMTLGIPAGRLLAEQIVSAARPAALEPFRFDRFGARARLGRARRRRAR
ncbi:MAG: FAD-binding oxidoreductase [Actinobacteria bacterium]|nr:FAD-binding oxidoreductase [Actinomycetota bacterium]